MIETVRNLKVPVTYSEEFGHTSKFIYETLCFPKDSTHKITDGFLRNLILSKCEKVYGWRAVLVGRIEVLREREFLRRDCDTFNSGYIMETKDE